MYILKVSFLIALFIITIAFAEQKQESQEPIIITSQKLLHDSKNKTATFEGNVVAKRGDMTMQANKMIVYYYEDEQKGSKIRMIEAIGRVRLNRASRLITSEKAVYYPEPEERVEFIGEPRATDGKNLIIGEKITYFVKDDRSLVEKSKVYLKEKK